MEDIEKFIFKMNNIKFDGIRFRKHKVNRARQVQYKTKQFRRRKKEGVNV